MQESFQGCFRCLREKPDQVFHEAFIGFLRGPEIDLFGEIITHFLLRCAVLGYAPAAADTVFINGIDEIPDDHIALLLQTGHGRIEAFLPFAFLPASGVCIAAELAQILGKDRGVFVDQIVQFLIEMAGQSFVPQRVEVISVAPVIGKVIKEIAADISGLFLKELPGSRVLSRTRCPRRNPKRGWRESSAPGGKNRVSK